MNPASAFLVRARATWPGTWVSTTVGCRETGGGARSPTQAGGLLHLLPPSPIPCLVMSAGSPVRDTQILGMGEEGSPSPQVSATPPGHGSSGACPTVTKFKCFHPLKHLEGPALRVPLEMIRAQKS